MLGAMEIHEASYPGTKKIKKKRTQHCTVCTNHGDKAPKKGHHCPFLNCDCDLCVLTKKAQTAMRHQQRVWRHQKQKLRASRLNSEGEDGEEVKSKSQNCDKCRNHNIIKLKRNHNCPFLNCDCEYCDLTFKRRMIMKHQQRVRRSKVTSAKPKRTPREENQEPFEVYEENSIIDTSEPQDLRLNRTPAPLTLNYTQTSETYPTTPEREHPGSPPPLLRVYDEEYTPKNTPPSPQNTFTNSQPLKSITALTESLEHSKFGVEDLRGYSWVPNTPLDLHFSRLPLHHFHSNLTRPQQPIRPLPISPNRSHLGAGHHLWNFIPLNFEARFKNIPRNWPY